MTLITFKDGKPLMRDGKVGTEQACCCGPCYTVSSHMVSACFGFGYDACACCAGYGLDLDAALAAMEAYVTGALAGAFTSRGFTVGSWSPVFGAIGYSTFSYTVDGDECLPEGECEAQIRTGEITASLCLQCDGVIVLDTTLDPLPTDEFNADAAYSEACSCGTNAAVPLPGTGGESLRCVPCGGACDEENPCPTAFDGAYACICVDGQCQRVLAENQFP